MTKEEIIRMARDAGLALAYSEQDEDGWEELGRFAALVAASEREACARVCEDTDIVNFEHCMVLHDDAAQTLRNAATAIRTRGKQE